MRQYCDELNEQAALIQEIDYEKDFILWVMQQIQLVRSGQMAALDMINLVEEMEDMGRNAQHAIMNNLIIVIWHLLKWRFQPERRSISWQLTLDEHRRRLHISLTKSPSLRPYALSIFEYAYQSARKKAAIETGLPLISFPERCPFQWQNILDMEFFGLEEPHA